MRFFFAFLRVDERDGDFATARASRSCLTLDQSLHRLLIVKLDLTSIYSSKTDDELLALAVERHSLEPEAQSALWAELKRRKLTDPSLRHHAMPEELPFPKQNPAFNTPAKIGALAIFLWTVGMGLTYAIAASHAHMLGTLVVGYVLICGPIFAGIAWGTHRALRNRSPRSPRRKL